MSTEWTAHTPDPTKYHDASLSGYRPGGDGDVANPPRHFGGVMLPRQDPMRRGMSSACNPHDPANHKMIIDPHLGGTSVYDPHSVPATSEEDYQREIQSLESQGLKGEELAREATSRLINQYQREAPVAAQPSPQPQTPLLKYASSLPPMPIAGSMPVHQSLPRSSAPAPKALLARFQEPPVASRAEMMHSPAAPVGEPEMHVTFEIPQYGMTESWYHDVKLEAGAEGTGFLILVCHNEFRGHKYFPPTVDQEIGVQVSGHSQIYKASVPGIKFVYENKTFFILFITNTMTAGE